MTSPSRDIPALAAEFTAAYAGLDLPEQRLMLATFRLLGEGQPFGAEELAQGVDLPIEMVASHLDNWPEVERNDHGRVVAFYGLSLEPTSHALEVDGRTLYAWCALDTLFLPELLGRPARITSTAPDSGETITLAVDGSTVHDISPEDAVMTLHEVSGLDRQSVDKENFCCFVHFFPTEHAANTWAQRNEGTYVVTIAEGFEYGHIVNHGVLGAALDRDDT